MARKATKKYDCEQIRLHTSGVFIKDVGNFASPVTVSPQLLNDGATVSKITLDTEDQMYWVEIKKSNRTYITPVAVSNVSGATLTSAEQTPKASSADE